MSIRDRLRPTSSIVASNNNLNDNPLKNDSVRVTAVLLSCDDTSNEGEVHREYTLMRGTHRTIDFVRATVVSASGQMSVAPGGVARVKFSSPVMSRRHARITFAEDGSVTVMDVGSMHGTYLQGANFCDFFSERLKPRRHYTLQSGDTLLLGKAINREREWKPVSIRLTFILEGNIRCATPPPNRYGMYVDSTGHSDLDEDTDSISTSDEEEEDHNEDVSVCSPDSSPLVSHTPLQMDGVPSTSAPFENLAGGSRNAEDSSFTSRVFDLNRTSSATNALRSMLPPFTTTIQTAMRRLPSIRELGLFGNTGASNASSNTDGNDAENVMVECQASELQQVALDVADVQDAIDHVPPSIESIEPSQEPFPLTSSIQVVEVDEQQTESSIFAWQEPSHPQNQLGLEFVEHDSLYTGSPDEEGNQNGDFELSSSESEGSVENDAAKENKGGEDEREDEKSMDISPCSSRGASPSFRTDAQPESNFNNTESSNEREMEEGEVCRCSNQEDEVRENNQEAHQERVEDSLHPEAEASSISMPVTPQPRSACIDLTYASSDDQEAECRPRRVERLNFGYYDPIPLSPISISKRGRRIGARHASDRRSAPHTPKRTPESATRTSGRFPNAAIQTPDMDILRARVHSLENRMQDMRVSAALAGAAAASSASASTSASIASVDEARKEMESMREEMRRLSRLMEILVAKMDVRASEPGRVEREIQAGAPRIGKEIETPLESNTRKRKRTEDICTLSATDAETERLFLAHNEQMSRPLEASIRLFHEPLVQPEVRPVKRARTVAREAVMMMAAAVGYMGFGATLAWATLAYVP